MPSTAQTGPYGMRTALFLLLAFISSALQVGCFNSEPKPEDYYGDYKHTLNDYTSSVTIVDGSRIKIAIRTGMGYADKSGTYTRNGNRLSVKWTSVDSNTLVANPQLGEQTGEIGAGETLDGTRFLYVELGTTKYLKRRD